MLNKKHFCLISTMLAVSLVFVFAVGGFAHAGVPDEFNFRGRTVNFGYVVDLLERHFNEPEDQAHLEDMEKLFNVNIEGEITPSVTSSGVLIEYLSPLVMAGDVEADVFITSNHASFIGGNEGLLYPLDDLLDDEYWDSISPYEDPEYYRSPIDGSFYAFRGDTMYAHRFGAPDLIIYNRSMIEREGLPSPYELWKDGEWTWEAFKDIAIRATQDTNSDGENDQWGLGAARGNLALLRYFAFSNNGAGVREIDGRLSFTLDEPEVMEALEFLQELHQEETVLTGGFSYLRNAFFEGNLAMYHFRPWIVSGLNDMGMEDDYSFVPMPKGPRADEHISTITHKLVYSMPINVQDPEGLIALSNALFKESEEYREAPSWEDALREDEDETIMALRDAESMEVMNWVYENQEMSVGFDTVFIPEITDLIDEILEEGVSPSAAVDAIKPSSQRYLDDLFN